MTGPRALRGDHDQPYAPAPGLSSSRYAAWATVLPWAMRDDDVRPAAVDAAQQSARRNLDRHLATVGAEAVTGYTVRLTDDFMTGEGLVLVETRAMVLRHRNPFPRFRPFRWLP